MQLDLGGLHPGGQLRIWRAVQDTSQKELSTRLGISDSHLSRLEAGEVTPGLELATRIEELTGIPATSWVRKESVA